MFSCPGIPESTPSPGGSVEGLKHALKIHTDGMEMEWVQRVPDHGKTASELRKIKEESGCALTAHGPYYINLNSLEDGKIEMSIKRIMKTARVGSACGCTSFTFHAAFMMGQNPKEVHKKVVSHLKSIQALIESEKLPIKMRPELTGKPSAWGSLEELLDACAQIPGMEPCIDWSHLRARTGGRFNSRDEFRWILKEYSSVLGDRSLHDMHMHTGGIVFGPKGERHHLPIRESDTNYKDLLRTFREFDIRGVCVTETPEIERDTLLLKRSYRQLQGRAAHAL